MRDLILGFDDNLGLPNDYSENIHLKTASYHDLAVMLDDFENNKLPLLFTPVGTLPYIKSDYSIIAQATFGLKRTNRIKTKLVTAKKLPLDNVLASSLGRVNPYCTTSFWAALIYFMDKAKEGTSIHFIDTDGFKDMLIKTAEQKIDSSIVWDIILERNPQYAAMVHELAVKDDLPTPVIISKESIPDRVKKELTGYVSSDTNSLFNGFTVADLQLLDSFREQMNRAGQYFKTNCS